MQGRGGEGKVGFLAAFLLTPLAFNHLILAIMRLCLSLPLSLSLFLSPPSPPLQGPMLPPQQQQGPRAQQGALQCRQEEQATGGVPLLLAPLPLPTHLLQLHSWGQWALLPLQAGLGSWPWRVLQEGP